MVNFRIITVGILIILAAALVVSYKINSSLLGRLHTERAEHKVTLETVQQERAEFAKRMDQHREDTELSQRKSETLTTKNNQLRDDIDGIRAEILTLPVPATRSFLSLPGARLLQQAGHAANAESDLLRMSRSASVAYTETRTTTGLASSGISERELINYTTVLLQHCGEIRNSHVSLIDWINEAWSQRNNPAPQEEE